MLNKDYLTLQETAVSLGKSAQTIRRMIKKGELKAQRMRTPQGFNYMVYSGEIRRPGYGQGFVRKEEVSAHVEGVGTRHEEPAARESVRAHEVPGVEVSAYAENKSARADVGTYARAENCDVAQRGGDGNLDSRNQVMTSQNNTLDSRGKVSNHEAFDNFDNRGMISESAAEELLENDYYVINSEDTPPPDLSISTLLGIIATHHKEKMMLFHILESMQAELNARKRQDGA